MVAGLSGTFPGAILALCWAWPFGVRQEDGAAVGALPGSEVDGRSLAACCRGRDGRGAQVVIAAKSGAERWPLLLVRNRRRA